VGSYQGCKVNNNLNSPIWPQAVFNAPNLAKSTYKKAKLAKKIEKELEFLISVLKIIVTLVHILPKQASKGHLATLTHSSLEK
jgi:hypothetical protein